MSLFTFKYRERDSELEKALQGIPFCGDITFGYNGQGKEKNKKITPPLYLLPVDTNHDVIYGYFTIDGKLREAPLGFLRRTNFLFKEYFGLDFNGALVQENVRENILYLPLALTDLLVDVGGVNDGKFTSQEGAPFPIFGVEGRQGRYPLILVSENEDGIKCRGLYKTKNGMIATYNHRDRASGELIKEFLRTLRGLPANTSKSLEERTPIKIEGIKKLN